VANPANSKKRYIIMTEVTSVQTGDKVHYPLPLNYIEDPEPDALRRTIERMRQQILMRKTDTFSSRSQQKQYTRLDDFASIEAEND
jgi:coiled-coil domain-containing protein 61